MERRHWIEELVIIRVLSGMIGVINMRYFAVGYLACTLFLTQDHELGIMLINTLQRDLKSQNYLDTCAALNAICYLEHEEMLDNVLDLVIQAMEFPK